MKSVLSVQDFLGFFITGLDKHDLKYVVSHNAFGRRIGEVFITEARELIMLPEELLDQSTIKWILEIRTPLSIRLTIFTHNVSEYKLRVARAVSELVSAGIDIPNFEHVVSVQQLSFENLKRLLDSLANWRDLKDRSEAQSRSAQESGIGEDPPPSFTSPSFRHTQGRLQESSTQDLMAGDTSTDYQSLHISLRNAIKTYWTERYLSRFLKTPPEKARKIARRVGVSRELCGREALYFFNRSKALSTYFSHILKGIFDELDIQYEETSQRLFFLPQLCLVIMFFEGDKEQLRLIAEDFVRTHDVIFVVPERLRATIGRITDDYFQVTPLARDHIFSLFQQIIKKRPPCTKPVQS